MLTRHLPTEPPLFSLTTTKYCNLYFQRNFSQKIRLSIKPKKFIKLVNSRAVLLKLAKIDSFKFGIKKAEAIPEFQSDKKTSLLPEFKKILKLSKNLAINNNSNFYFVYLPDFSSVKNSFYKDYNLSLNKKYFEIKLLLDELNIPLIDIKYIYLKKVDDYRKFIPFELNDHLNANGYKRIAEIIDKELK